MRKYIGLFLATALVATACTDGEDPETRRLDPTEVVLASGLETVNSCDALLERIQDEALDRVGPYGLEGSGGPITILEDFAMEDFDAIEESSAAQARPSFDPATNSGAELSATTRSSGEASSDEVKSFTGTNNQEVDVDESDIVKTDGETILVVRNSELYVVDVSSSTLTKTIELPNYQFNGEIFMQDNLALIMSQGENFITEDTEFGGPEDFASTRPFGFSTTHLTVIDLDSGEVISDAEIDGNYLSAREVDGTIRVVISTPQNNTLPWLQPQNRSGESAATEANKTIIKESTIEDWIPKYSGSDQLVDCDKVHLPKEFAGFGLVTVLTLDIDDSLNINDSVSVFTNAQDVYASTNRLVVSTPQWSEPNFVGEILDIDTEYKTAIHSFDISDKNATNYVASGEVRGSLLNRFSMSEHDGYLRVATTAGNPWGERSSESYVTVFEEDDGALKEIGQVGDLGRGERIFAVRFLGNKGYVVTFRQTDPLYVVDLSDPTNPETLGELKIPGFSEYLHPIDDDTLMGIGTDGDDNGATGYPVATLFDVSDPTNPTMTAKVRLSEDPSAGALPAQDSRSFNFYEDNALVPVQSYKDGGLVKVAVDGKSLTLNGEVTHPEQRNCEEIYFEEEPFFEDDIDPGFTTTVEPGRPQRVCNSFSSNIFRSIVIDGDLYTVSDEGIQVNEFDSLDQKSWIKF